MKLLAVAITLALIPMQLHAGAIAQKALDEFVIYNLPGAFKSGAIRYLEWVRGDGLRGGKSR